MIDPSRRDLLLAPLLAALLTEGRAEAAGVDPAQTFIQQAGEIKWEIGLDRPPKTVEYANLSGKSSEAGIYLNLTRWYPGFMSAPHWYETDRLCVVVSGTWWVASGEKFDPESAVPVPAGGFIRRVAHTPHYDGVLKSAKEPAIIAICGVGPIKFHSVDESKPSWRVL
jgi:hypothetical protein